MRKNNGAGQTFLYGIMAKGKQGALHYIRLLKRKLYIGFAVVLGCACLGSIRGAWKEYNEPPVGVTQEDLEMMEAADGSAPDLIGVMPLAASQNRWHNFSYAAIYAGRGLVLYGIMMAVYLPMYHCKVWIAFRRFLGREAGEREMGEG